MITRRNILAGMAAVAVVLPARPILANDPRRLFFYDLYVKGTTTLSDKALGLNATPVHDFKRTSAATTPLARLMRTRISVTDGIRPSETNVVTGSSFCPLGRTW